MGAGPYYGVFPLAYWDQGGWEENDGFIGTLSKPFPHTEPWNDLSGEPEYEEARYGDPEWEAAYEARLNAFDEQYWSPEQVHGAIPICHVGCALRLWLIVSGPEADHVWNDFRADHRGLYPVEGKTGSRVTFLEWYREWLNEALA